MTTSRLPSETLAAPMATSQHRISPNMVSFARIGLIPVLVLLLLERAHWHGQLTSFILFFLMAASDGLDGMMARRHGRVTTLGVFLDPLADKLLIASALVCLVQLREINAWVVVVIIGREFAVTGLRVMAATQGENIAANRFGKAKTAFQIWLVMSLIPTGTWHWLQIFFEVMAVIFTLGSGAEYFWAGRRYLKEVPPPPIAHTRVGDS